MHSLRRHSSPGRLLGLLGLLGLISCGEEQAPAGGAPGTDTASEEEARPPFDDSASYEPLPPAAMLRRLSLDLRGVPPSLEELAALEADPEALSTLREAYLEDPRWQRRFADLMADHLLMRVDAFNATVDTVGIDVDSEYDFERAVSDEPLVLLAALAVADRPWTDAVTVDWTVTNEILEGIYEVEEISLADAGLEVPLPAGWVPARYADDRPAGGVLMTTGLWWRYWSAPNNYNRTRAAALSRLFLCEDFLLRPISFEASSLLDRDSLNDATRTEEACVGCHAGLDPLAASLFGFWWFDIYALPEMQRYHAEREWLGSYYLDMEPAWFGRPMDGPADLGPFLAADPRFLTCTVETVAKGLLRRELTEEDHPLTVALLDDFQAGELRMRALVEAVLDRPEYQAGALTTEASEAAEAKVATRRVLGPSQLADSVETLTGFRWTEDSFDQLLNDDLGYRILAGGMDGVAVGRPQEDPSLTRLLVLQRLSEGAGRWVAEEDLALPAEERRLLTQVEESTRPGDAAFTSQLEELHLRFWSRAPTEAELEEEEALFTAVSALSDPRTAWATLISVLIRDPAFWTT